MLAQAALRAYGLDDARLEPIRLINNAVFSVRPRKGEARLVLRIHRPGYRTFDQVRSELEFLKYMGEQLDGSHVEAPRPVATADGELVFRVPVAATSPDATRCCDLLTFVDGRVLRHGSGLGQRSVRLLGEGLARVHDAADAFNPPAGFDLPRWDADAMFSETSSFRPGPMEEFLAAPALALFGEVAERTRTIFEELDAAPGQRGIVHHDYILINCLFTRKTHGWTLGILDFDDIGLGYFLYDLAPMLGNLFDYLGAYRTLRRAFLDGYRRVRELPDGLEAHLPVLMAARHATTLTWLAAKQRRGETDIPIDRQVEIRISEMARCLEHHSHRRRW